MLVSLDHLGDTDVLKNCGSAKMQQLLACLLFRASKFSSKFKKKLMASRGNDPACGLSKSNASVCYCIEPLAKCVITPEQKHV